MKIKLKKSQNKIIPALGWTFKSGAFNQTVITAINKGDEVEVEFIPPLAMDLVEEAVTKKGGI